MRTILVPAVVWLQLVLCMCHVSTSCSTSEAQLHVHRQLHRPDPKKSVLITGGAGFFDSYKKIVAISSEQVTASAVIGQRFCT
jgi:hypothetical protein